MTWDHRNGDAMNEDASNPTAADERPRLIIIGLIVWIILQVPRLIAIPLIQGVLDDTESDAWMFPAILLDAITAGLLAPPPQIFGGGSGPSPAVAPGLQLLIDLVALWLLTRRNVKRYYLDTTVPEH
jgi:hypothetical protein